MYSKSTEIIIITMKGGKTNMTQKNRDYAKGAAWLAGGALVVAAVAPGFYMAEPENGLTEDQVKTLMADALAGLNLTDADKVDAIYADIFKGDAWEAEAEVLALEELEDDSYEYLFDAMVKKTGNGLNLSIDDEDDIDRVIVKDVSFLEGGFDVDDKDAKVKLELKVYFEDHSGDDRKEYITAIATILDGEVDKLRFSFTD